MSDPILKQAGAYTLHSFVLYSYDRKKSIDIKMLIHNFNLFESMSTSSIRGSASVYDTGDLIKNFPLLCEEYVEITYSDFFDVKRTDRMFVYSITDVTYPKEKNQAIISFTLNFVSVARVFTEDFRVQKTYKNTPTNGGIISGYVKDVFDEYYVKPVQEYGVQPKEIEVEQTTGQTQFVIPRLTPEQTMQFFSRRAYSANRKTQMFRFFESREKYYFASNEYMATVGVDLVGGGVGQVDPGLAKASNNPALRDKSIPVFTMNYAGNVTPERQEGLMYEIQDINFGVRVNTIEDISIGGYKRRTFELDMVNGSIVQVDYDHAEEFNEDKLKLPHSKPFIDNQITKYRERFVMKDYASPGMMTGYDLRPDQNFSDLYNIKMTNFYHYEKNKISLKVYGTNKLFAGDMVTLQLFERTMDNSLREDTDRSGTYIVESVDNNFYENIFTQSLVVSRGGIGTE